MAIYRARWDERRSPLSYPLPGDRRPTKEKDRSRVIHCAAFRRLQGKTQVLGVGEGDFHRTRLTHSMEVAQIGRGLVLQLKEKYADDEAVVAALPSVEQIETIGFAHDLGHPPFGHRGEAALNYMMRRSEGFEGNGQSLRLLTRLELQTPNHGLNLSRRALLGILKYPLPLSRVRARDLPPDVGRFSQLLASHCSPPKCYLDTETEIVKWILEPFSDADRGRFQTFDQPSGPLEHAEPQYKALDTSILEIADDVAYGTHDVEDGIALGFITRDHWEKASRELDDTWAKSLLRGKEDLASQLFGSPDENGNRKLAIGLILNAMVVSVEIRARGEFQCPVLDYEARLSEQARRFVDQLRLLTKHYIVQTPSVQALEYRGQQMLMSLFEALDSDPMALLPESYRTRCQGDRDRQRCVCDYVAGMTDSYAIRMYERLFVPRQGSIFERL